MGCVGFLAGYSRGMYRFLQSDLHKDFVFKHCKDTLERRVEEELRENILPKIKDRIPKD